MITVSAREFTNRDGQKMEAEPVSVDGDAVVFEKSTGNRFSYSLAKLSDEDQAFLKEWAKKPQKAEFEVTRAQAIQIDKQTTKSSTEKTTIEFRAYEVFLRNSGPIPVDGVVCCYALFPKINDRYDKGRNKVLEPTQGKVELATIPARGEMSFKTQPVRLESKDLATDTTLMRYDESLAGGNFHFYVGDRLVASHYVGAFKEHGTLKPSEIEKADTPVTDAAQ